MNNTEFAFLVSTPRKSRKPLANDQNKTSHVLFLVEMLT